jgi:ABC-type branched-subunit amino acid transport system permease subunit
VTVGKRLITFMTTRPNQTFAVAVLLAAVIVPPLLASYWLFLTTAAMVTAIAAIGLAIIVGWVGEINLAGGALLGTSAYISSYLLRQESGNFHGWPFVAAAIVGIAAAAALSGLVAIPTARLSGIYVMVLTLGLQITIERTLFAFPWIIGGFGRNIVITRPELFGFSFDSDLRFFYLCFGVMVVSGLFAYALRKSRHGRAMNLVRTDRRAAAAVGVSPWRYKVLAFVVGGGLIGLAGSLASPLYRAPPTPVQYIEFQSLFLLSIPIVAGTDTLVGIVAVAIVFALIPQALESHELSPYLLAGAGLLAGTLVGARGMGGVLLDMIQKKREVALLAAAASRSDAIVAPVAGAAVDSAASSSHVDAMSLSRSAGRVGTATRDVASVTRPETSEPAMRSRGQP